VVRTVRIKEAAELLGVSGDTLRRWADAGRIETITDSSGRLAVDGVALCHC
jgi:excisionase family DNA binding protein